MLKQILDSIHKLELWNESYFDVNEMLPSPDGVKTLAADCMLIEAIGEGFKRIYERTKQQLLPTCPEIPWNVVKGMRLTGGQPPYDKEWSPLNILIHYLKNIYLYENGLIDKHAEEMGTMELSFKWQYIPLNYPQPEEYL